MKSSKVLALTSEHFQHLMEQASAGFELDCKQACRGLKVSMAVNVFGLGTLMPNNFADEATFQPSDEQPPLDDDFPAMRMVAKRTLTERSRSIDMAEHFHR
ncbi:hypothetical protein GXB78_22125 [Pseudomonas moraviensis subsp. stanleyae]|uniref:hypothetical protein n=1 Tax=Pseudomonas moraviensis TaxID=321662 RepID=UPI002E2F8470|nr:hypothetical protein [Pseudomonas moraviensis]MED7669911.1 hypothetical protein [Pseudomonas moraviensis subsp. stanleyae]